MSPSAAGSNQLVARLGDFDLVAEIKPGMAALGAAMRKLLMIAYGVLKSQTKFNADILKPTETPA